MWGAVHPPVEGGLGRGAASGEDVLAYPRPVVSLGVDALADAGAIRSGVREEGIAGHVGAMISGRSLKLPLHTVCSQPLILSFLVDQGQQGAFICTVPGRDAAWIRR